MSTGDIEQPVQRHDGRTCDCHLERLGELPAVGVRVVALHRVQAEVPLPAPHGVHKAIQHRKTYSKREKRHLDQISG